MNNDFLWSFFLTLPFMTKTLWSTLKTHLSSYVYVQAFAFIKGRNFCLTHFYTWDEFSIGPKKFLKYFKKILKKPQKPQSWIDISYIFCFCGIFVLAWKVIHSPKVHGNFFFHFWWFAWKLLCPWLKQHIFQSGAHWQFSHTNKKKASERHTEWELQCSSHWAKKWENKNSLLDGA